MSEPIKDGGPAFPVDLDGSSDCATTLRDYFAAAALQGILAAPEWYTEDNWWNAFAGDAYKLADAMLAAREDTPC